MSEKTKTAAVASSVTAVIMVCLFILFLQYTGAFSQGTEEKALAEKLMNIQAIIDKNSIYEFDVTTAENNAAYGYLHGINDDQYFMYYSQDEYESYISTVNGDGSGVGIIMSYNSSGLLSDGIFIRRVVGGSPAEEAGIKAGDKIVNLNGQDLTGMRYADVSDSLIVNAGDVMQFGIIRNEEYLNFEVTASLYSEREVDYYKTSDGYGYIRIYRFATNASEQFRAALEDLCAQGVTGLILDVRGNGGGELETVCKMVDMLVSEGDIIIMKTKSGEDIRSSTPDKLIDVPYVVLVNHETASAAEMFSSSLRDLVGAPLIGEKTYGKAVGQTFFGLQDGSAVKITTFQYFTQNRVDFNGIGLEPDDVIEFDAEKTKRLYCLREEEDLQLLRAVEHLKSKIG